MTSDFKSSGLKLVECPFNSTHVMLEENLQRHILRCMKNYPNYYPCVFNAMHRFRTKEELTEHLKTCPSRYENYNPEPVPIPKANMDGMSSRKFHFSEENWDDEYPFNLLYIWIVEF